MLPFLQLHIDLSNFSSFHTPAVARYFFDLKDQEDIPRLHEIYMFAREKNLPIVFLGGGTNVLFAFDVFEGIIIRNTIRGMSFDNQVVTVSGGEILSLVSLKIGEKEPKSLFNKWVGLPGTVGGAIVGNAGCFGFEVRDTLIEVTIFDTEIGEYKTLSNTDLHFSYRHSLLKNKPYWFIVEAKFRTDLFGDDTTDPRTFRAAKQPSGFTCGSFFRNPPGDSAGRLIDQVGLKGYRIGGAKISEVHANFFINDENASYTDILALRDMAKQRVHEQFSIDLQEEVRIIGHFC